MSTTYMAGSRNAEVQNEHIYLEVNNNNEVVNKSQERVTPETSHALLLQAGLTTLGMADTEFPQRY